MKDAKFQVKPSDVSSRITQLKIHSTLKPEGDEEVGLSNDQESSYSAEKAPFSISSSAFTSVPR